MSLTTLFTHQDLSVVTSGDIGNPPAIVMVSPTPARLGTEATKRLRNKLTDWLGEDAQPEIEESPAPEQPDQRDSRIAELENLLAETEAQVREMAAHRAQQQDEIRQLRKQAEKLQDKAEKLEKTGAELTRQVEEASVSPLNLEQQQRAKALTIAREVVERTGGSSLLKGGSSQASTAGLLSAAHFIIGGGRDYVTTDGEYVLDSDRRAAPTRTATHLSGWQSGIEDVMGWIVDHVDAEARIALHGCDVDQDRDGLLTAISDFFADPAVAAGDEPGSLQL
jgi:uncharacterized coiled-coil protein SlyX